MIRVPISLFLTFFRLSLGGGDTLAPSPFLFSLSKPHNNLFLRLAGCGCSCDVVVGALRGGGKAARERVPSRPRLPPLTSPCVPPKQQRTLPRAAGSTVQRTHIGHATSLTALFFGERGGFLVPPVTPSRSPYTLPRATRGSHTSLARHRAGRRCVPPGTLDGQLRGSNAALFVFVGHRRGACALSLGRS